MKRIAVILLACAVGTAAGAALAFRPTNRSQLSNAPAQHWAGSIVKGSGQTEVPRDTEELTLTSSEGVRRMAPTPSRTEASSARR